MSARERQFVINNSNFEKKNFSNPEIELKTTEAARKRDEYRMRVPNVLEKEVPSGNDETGNVEIKKYNKKIDFDFDARSHNELLDITGSADLDRAAKISGRRFYYPSLRNE